jgi:hypothetical protein
MSKIKNRKQYKHNIDLIKYSENGLVKRCKGCAKESNSLQTSGYCNECWALWFREKRKGKTLKETFEKYENVWLSLKEKYKNIKKCNTCFTIKNKTEFYPDKKSPHGLQNKCIGCVKEYNSKYGYVAKRDRPYQNNLYNNNIQYKIKTTLRNRFYSAVIKNYKIKSVLKLIGCSIDELKIHLETQFKPEMNWENHGNLWEIDHIKPCNSFDLTKLEEQKQCFHYTNLQPLFKTTEIAKKYGYDEIGNRNKGTK